MIVIDSDMMEDAKKDVENAARSLEEAEEELNRLNSQIGPSAPPELNTLSNQLSQSQTNSVGISATCNSFTQEAERTQRNLTNLILNGGLNEEPVNMIETPSNTSSSVTNNTPTDTVTYTNSNELNNSPKNENQDNVEPSIWDNLSEGWNDFKEGWNSFWQGTKNDDVEVEVKTNNVNAPQSGNVSDKKLAPIYTLDDDGKIVKKPAESFLNPVNQDDKQNNVIDYEKTEEKKLTVEEFKEAMIDLKNEIVSIYQNAKDSLELSYYTWRVDVKTKVYDTGVSLTQHEFSTKKPNTEEYKEESKKCKDDFAAYVLEAIELGTLEKVDVPDTYLKTAKDDYEKAKLYLAFSDMDEDSKALFLSALYEIEQNIKGYNYDTVNDNMKNQRITSFLSEQLDIVYSTEEAFRSSIQNENPEDAYRQFKDLASKTVNENESSSLTLGKSTDLLHINEKDLYNAVEGTKALAKLKEDTGISKEEDLYKYINDKSFMTLLYQEDGIEGLEALIYNDKSSKNINDIGTQHTIFNNVIDYATKQTVIEPIYNKVLETQENIVMYNDSVEQIELLNAKKLDTASVTDKEVEDARKEIEKHWSEYCKDRDFKQYCNDYETYLRAYALLLREDKELANDFWNTSDPEGKNRGVLDEKIMDGFAFDVAKDRVGEMTGIDRKTLEERAKEEGVPLEVYVLYHRNDDLNGKLGASAYTAAYGFGYGITGFIDGIKDVVMADGKQSGRDKELMYINMLLQGDYSIYSQYQANDAHVLSMLSTDYSLNDLKITDDKQALDIMSYKEQNIPRFEIEYLMGNISYEEYAQLKTLNDNIDDAAY